MRKSALFSRGVLLAAGLCQIAAGAAVLVRTFRGSAYPAALYVLRLVGGVLTLLAVRLDAAARANIVLCLASIVTTAYAAEGVLMYARPDVAGDGPPGPAAAAATTKFDVVQELRAAGEAVQPSIYPSVFRPPVRGEVDRLLPSGFLPLAGISRVTTVHCREAGDFTVYRSDRHGFSNPPGSWSGPVSVAVVGDSFVHGACVPPDSNLVAWLRRRRPRALNLGMDGNGPVSMLATVVEYAAAVEPEIVVWAYYEANDLHDLRSELATPRFASYLSEGHRQDLVRRQAEIDSVLRVVGEAAERNLREALRASRGAPGRSPLDFVKLTRVRALLGVTGRRTTTGARAVAGGPAGGDADGRTAVPPRERAGALASYREVLSNADRVVASWGGRLVFVYLPSWHRFAAEDGREVEPEEAWGLDGRRNVMAIAAALDVPVIDVLPAFAERVDAFDLFALGGEEPAHYNTAGYRLAAEVIGGGLRRLEER